jgi:hypothetical protein
MGGGRNSAKVVNRRRAAAAERRKGNDAEAAEEIHFGRCNSHIESVSSFSMVTWTDYCKLLLSIISWSLSP